MELQLTMQELWFFSASTESEPEMINYADKKE